jgi:hypothetical protein
MTELTSTVSGSAVLWRRHFMNLTYRVFRAQVDWTSILPSEFPAKDAAPLVEQNAIAWHHVLRSLISLHNEHPIYVGQLSASHFFKDEKRTKLS